MLRFDVTEEAPRADVETLVASRLGVKKPIHSEKDAARVELEGTFSPPDGKSARIFVHLERTPLQRGGTRPFTEVVLDEDLGAPMELRGAHGLHLPTDAPVAFASEALADVVLIGAPHGLVRDVADLLDARLTALSTAGAEVITLEIGPYAERAGAKKRGVRLVCRGWPLDETALDHLFSMLIAIRAKIADHGAHLERHPDVIAHERALVFGPGSPAKTKLLKRMALVGAAFFLLALLLALLVSLLPSNGAP